MTYNLIKLFYYRLFVLCTVYKIIILIVFVFMKELAKNNEQVFNLIFRFIKEFT